MNPYEPPDIDEDDYQDIPMKDMIYTFLQGALASYLASGIACLIYNIKLGYINNFFMAIIVLVPLITIDLLTMCQWRKRNVR